MLYGLPFTDENKMEEIREVMNEILGLITTEDEEQNMENLERFA